MLAVDGVNATIKRGRDAVKVHGNRVNPFLEPGFSGLPSGKKHLFFSDEDEANRMDHVGLGTDMGDGIHWRLGLQRGDLRNPQACIKSIKE